MGPVMRVETIDERLLQESELISIVWEREFRDLVFNLEGLWLPGQQMPSYGQPARLILRNCLWADFQQKQSFAENTYERDRHSLTMLSWHDGDPSTVPTEVRPALAQGYRVVEFISEETLNYPWLSAVCREIDLTLLPA